MPPEEKKSDLGVKNIPQPEPAQITPIASPTVSLPPTLDSINSPQASPVTTPIPPVTRATPPPLPVPPPAPPPPIENKEPVREHPIKSLRTYQGDVEETLAKTKLGASTILVAEQKRRLSMPLKDEAIATVVRNKSFIVLGITLLLLGTLFLGVVYYVRPNRAIEIAKQTKALVSFSEEKVIPIANMGKAELVQSIVLAKESWNKQPNDILYINTVGADLSSALVGDLLKVLSPKMPASLSRSFEDEYMLGIYSFDTNQPFIILTTKDFPSSFEGMLKWEKNMIGDLGEIFSISQNTPLNTPDFVDEALVNKDLRVIKNNENKVVLLYSFIDKNTLVITGSENVFTALIGRYLIVKQQQ